MYTVFVRLEVHPESVEEFIAGIRANARATLRDEPGCIRFDVHQELEAPCTFHLHEIYSDRDAFHIAHRAAPHYATWRQVVAKCVVSGTHHNTYAEPLFPSDILGSVEHPE